jgi:Sulfotransferase family
MATLLIILCPPRSFSSVVATMIGQHPELYGFPELQLFSDESMDTLLIRREKRGKAVPAGLARFIAQEVFGIQNARTALQAIDWIRERRSWSTKQMLDYAIHLVAPKIGVEKSPGTSSRFSYMERAARDYPDAYFLHLTRHPVSTRQSMEEFFGSKTERARRHGSEAVAKEKPLLREAFDSLILWHHMHTAILRFTNGLPAGTTMRVKGEDLLSDPDRYLAQIAEWMGLRTDAEAIACMKHPEESPYAYTGPRPISGGNDQKFMCNPRLRTGRVREPSLEAFVRDCGWSYASQEFKAELAGHPATVDLGISDDAMLEDVRAVTHLLGYQ